MILRPYQDRIDTGIRDCFARKVRRGLVVAPCGTGKTVIFSHIGQGASKKGKDVLMMMHRKELIMQCSNKLSAFDVDHGIIKAGIAPHYNKNIQVGSVQTVINHLDDIRAPHLIIPDEAHHSQNVTQQTIIKKYPDSLLLGFTASPVFGNGRTLGGYYDEIIIGPTVREMIDEGYLVDSMVFAPPLEADLEGADYNNIDDLEYRMNKRKVTGNAIEHYQRVAHGMSAIVYCTTVKHAEDVAQQFREAGYSFYRIDGTMKPGERDQLLQDFAAGRIQGLTSCDLIGEGTDVPRARVAIKLAPTHSLGKHIQNDGRVNRPLYATGFDLNTQEGRLQAIAASEKPYAIILDHVNNLFFHGLPSDEWIWSLTEAPVAKRQGDLLIPIQQCPSCWLHHPPALRCPYCGAVREIQQRKLIHTKGQLIIIKRDAKATLLKLKADKKAASAAKKIEDERIRVQKEKERKAAKTFAELVAHGKKWGYDKPEGWAAMQIRNRSAWKTKK